MSETSAFNGDDPGRIWIERDGEKTLTCNYAHDVMEILLNRGKSTNDLWEKLLPILWEIEGTVHHEDTDLLTEKLLIEAKFFNATVTRNRELEPTGKDKP